MLKNILFLFVFIFTTLGLADSQYDKSLVVQNQSRNDKVVSVFKAMMEAYEEEDQTNFFSYVSEERFIQDYMTFYDAIEKDFRIFDILSIDTWVDKITDDGIKRYLYVRWEKRYQSTNNNNELLKRGYSRFLFDEVNGHYKLIGLAGNNFWGESLPEWKEEVPQIAGQEVYELPDLTIKLSCSGTTGTFVIQNIGGGDTTNGSIEYRVTTNASSQDFTYDSDLAAGEESNPINANDVCLDGGVIIVDPNNSISESNEENNEIERTIS